MGTDTAPRKFEFSVNFARAKNNVCIFIIVGRVLHMTYSISPAPVFESYKRSSTLGSLQSAKSSNQL